MPKPFDNDEIRLVVRRALERTLLARENRLLLERIEREYGFENLIGSGPAMQRVFETLRKVAETDLTVLVRGESGTGKELVAQALHQRSAAARASVRRGELRGDQPRAGRERAVRPREGRLHRRRRAPHRASFEAADGGTIFLDEIGDMAPATQAKVLRVLQERQLRARRRQRRRSRWTCASSRRRTATSRREVRGRALPRGPLLPAAASSRSRCPPLRERREDVPALVQRFLAQLAERHGRGPKVLDAGSRSRALARHAWPGNVRELRNVDRAAPRCCATGEAIDASDLQLRRERRALVPRRPRALSFGEAKRRAIEELRARLPASSAARPRRQRLAHRRGDRHGAAEPAAEDPRARPARSARARRRDPPTEREP